MHSELRLPNRITPYLAYIIGTLVGDGSIYKREKKHDYIIKCVGNPKDEKELYSQVLKPYFTEIFNLNLDLQLHDSETTYGYVIHSKELFEYLTLEIGLNSGKKDSRLGIPKIIKNNPELIIPFVKGLFDTDGCICFKKRYQKVPYYPVISLSSQSKRLILEVSKILKKMNFKIVETYDYTVKDSRLHCGVSTINRIELNGRENLGLWLTNIGFESPKHIEKIKKWSGYSGKRI
jgi:intein/homing endonuclease